MKASNPQGIDWNGLKAASIALQSVNEAARRASVNLPPAEAERFRNRVNKRAYRERWLDQDATLALTATTRNAMPLSQNVQTGSELLSAKLKQDAEETKSDLSTGIKAAAKYISEQPGKLLMAGADKVKHIVGAASQLHGWEQQSGNAGSLNLNILMGQAVIVQSPEREQ